MSEPQLPPHPVTQSQDPEADPLLGTGSYTHPARNNSDGELPQQQLPEDMVFPPGVAIMAEPISMYIPGDDYSPEGTPEATPRAVRRRDPEEMKKRPEWLPEGWTIDLKVRSSGATAGLIDRYYVEPTGQRRFRSKNEVLHFLQTGSKPPSKRKSASETEATPSASSSSQKQKRSYTKRKKPDASVSGSTESPQVVNSVQEENGNRNGTA